MMVAFWKASRPLVECVLEVMYDLNGEEYYHPVVIHVTQLASVWATLETGKT